MKRLEDEDGTVELTVEEAHGVIVRMLDGFRLGGLDDGDGVLAVKVVGSEIDDVEAVELIQRRFRLTLNQINLLDTTYHDYFDRYCV